VVVETNSTTDSLKSASNGYWVALLTIKMKKLPGLLKSPHSVGAAVDALVDSEEYQTNFGDTTVPYQRRRFKDRPINLVTPRYGNYWRDKLETERWWGDIRNYMDMAHSLN